MFLLTQVSLCVTCDFSPDGLTPDSTAPAQCSDQSCLLTGSVAIRHPPSEDVTAGALHLYLSFVNTLELDTLGQY